MGNLYANNLGIGAQKKRYKNRLLPEFLKMLELGGIEPPTS